MAHRAPPAAKAGRAAPGRWRRTVSHPLAVLPWGALAVIAPTIDPVALAYHELRSPLGLVATAARAVADDCTDDATRVRCEMIVRAAERMLRTAGQVFQLNRACEANAVRYRPAEVVRDLVHDLRGLDVHVRLRMREGVLDLETDGVREQFEALVHTLITNALDHGEPTRDIRVSLRMRDGRFVVAVRNRMAARGRHHGEGMGAYIAHELAHRLGARLTASRRGETYTAEVALPLAPRATVPPLT